MRKIDYKEKFEKLLNSGKPVYNKDNEKLVLKKDEKFEQCWADTKTRNTFPAYWFVSNKGSLISAFGKKLKWIKPYKRANGSGYYKYYIYDGNECKIKNIQAQNLVAIVFECNAYGMAKDLLAKEGVFSFGINSKDRDINQGHHVDGDNTNNSADNITIVTDKMHGIVSGVPAADVKQEKIFDFMCRCGDRAAKEVPDGVSLLTTGQILHHDGTWADDGRRDIMQLNSDDVKSIKDQIDNTLMVNIVPYSKADLENFLALSNDKQRELKNIWSQIIDNGLNEFDYSLDGIELHIVAAGRIMIG